MRLTSPVFEQNGSIPAKYTCQGDNVNPPLQIDEIPEAAESLVLICDDPDAATDPNGPGHTYDHWLVWNMPSGLKVIAENTTPQGSVVGKNGSGDNVYTGPCPPTGRHRYFFKLYALDRKLDLPAESGKNELMDALSGHVLARTELVGTYQKV